MKFIVIKSNLKDGLSIVEKASGENLNLPILKNILIETINNRIKLTATNLEIAISYFTTGKVIENGRFTVPVGIFTNLINNIQSDRLNIEKKGGRLEVKTDNYEATIQGLPADDFPLTPKIKDADQFVEIKTEILKEALEQVLVATQFSDLRPELNSVLFDFSIETLKLVATDSFRLAERIINSSQFNTNHKQGFKILIPLKTTHELSRVLRDGEVMKIYHDDNQILFKTEQSEFLSRLVDGSFPEYSAIIPKKFSVETILNRQEFINALRLTSVFGSKSGEVKIRSHDNKKVVEIISRDQSIGENNYILSAKIQGKLKETVFNWRYIADALKALKTEDVFFGINEETEPAAIKPSPEGLYIYILKPIVSA